MVHNLRSALDCVAYALAQRHVGVVLTDKQEEATQFPICKDAQAFDRFSTAGFPHYLFVRIGPFLSMDRGFSTVHRHGRHRHRPGKDEWVSRICPRTHHHPTT